MGSSHSDINESEFNKSWRVVETVDHLTVWENRDNPAHQLEQYYVRDPEDANTRKLYTLRKHSPYLVGAYILRNDGFGCCTDRQGSKVFIERIPLRLSNLEDIPFPDVLHLLDACLQGFKQLSSVVGYFRVDEDQVGVNERGQVKVWLSTAFESTQLVGSRSVPQHEMLQDILSLVFQAEDAESYPANVPPLVQAIGLPDRSATFDSIGEQFKNYVKQHTESYVPVSLQCVHAAGGAHLINDWCRSNRSYGFDQNTLRLSEKAFQSKFSKIQTSTISPEEEEKRKEINLIDSQLANALQARIQQQPIEAQPLPVESKPLPFQVRPLPMPVESRAPVEGQSLLRITSGVQQQQQLEGQGLAQLHHRVIQPQQASQVLPPQPQRIVQMIPQQRQQITPEALQQIQIQQPVFIPQQQRVFNQPQPVFFPQQVRQQIIPIQETVIPQQFVPQQQPNVYPTQPQPQQQPQQQPIFARAVSSKVSPVSPQGDLSGGQPSIQYLQRQGSRKEIVSEVFQQGESRLQQQRVISQTIQIKDNSKVNETNAFPTPSLSYEPKRNSEIPSDDALHSYARAVPFSVNVADQTKFTPADDGKSSPDFLALLSQLKSGSRNDYEVYSQVADTPSYAKAELSEASPKQYFNYLPQQTYSQGVESGQNISEAWRATEESPQGRYGTGYDFSKYERNLDPDLQADLATYKQ